MKLIDRLNGNVYQSNNVTLYQEPYERFAPYIIFHENESFFSMDPVEFIRISRFRHYRKGQKDQGYNRNNGKWETTNSHASKYYNIPISVINSYTLHSNGKNRRPRDDNSGHNYDVFLEPDNHPRGDSNPTSRVPTFYYTRISGNSLLISYWWFMGYNSTDTSFNHQGDWEHISVEIRNDQIVKLWYAAHGNPKKYLPSEVNWEDGHPLVYCALGTHASYPRPGNYRVEQYGIKILTDKTSNGYKWDISQLLLPLAEQPWKDYAGAWGNVGEFDFTTGPLGPWFKLAD